MLVLCTVDAASDEGGKESGYDVDDEEPRADDAPETGPIRCVVIQRPGVLLEKIAVVPPPPTDMAVETLLSTDKSIIGVAPHSLRGVPGQQDDGAAALAGALLHGDTRATTTLLGVGRELGVAGGVIRVKLALRASELAPVGAEASYSLPLLLWFEPGVFMRGFEEFVSDDSVVCR